MPCRLGYSVLFHIHICIHTYIHAVTYSTVSHIRSRGAYSYSYATACVRFCTVREAFCRAILFRSKRKAEKAANCAAVADDY